MLHANRSGGHPLEAAMHISIDLLRILRNCVSVALHDSSHCVKWDIWEFQRVGRAIMDKMNEG